MANNDGGAFYCDGPAASLTDVNIVGNVAGNNGDGIYNSSGSGTSLGNSNLVGNGYAIFNNDQSGMIDAEKLLLGRYIRSHIIQSQILMDWEIV